MKNQVEVCNWFSNIAFRHDGRVAVYGLGKYAHIIGTNMQDGIVCFCDKDQQDGTFLGRPVLPISRLKDMEIDAVVIATGVVAERIVYERINSFCFENRIALYGLHSGDMSKIGRSFHPLGLDGEERKQILWREIESHEVICFDCFDTLLMRRTLYPMDVFDIVEHRAKRMGLSLLPGFKNYRNQAEVGGSIPHKGLSGIYQELKQMIGLTEEETTLLMEMEMQAERDVLLPRPSIAEAFYYAKRLGKQVFLVSDMYLPPEFLREVLAEHGISGFDGLYVSDDRGTGKSEGLFDLLQKEHPASSYLHIGDNADVDGWGARSHGVDAFLIESAIDMFRASGANQPFKYLDTFNERLLVGFFLVEAYADPFRVDADGGRHVRDVPDFARLFVAPLAVSFMVWLLHKVKEQDFSAVLFASRDGYAFKQMYDEAVNILQGIDMPRSIYLYISRKLAFAISMQDETDLEWMHDCCREDVWKFMEEVFALPNYKMRSGRTNDDLDFRVRMTDCERKHIYKKSKEMRSGYMTYLKKLGIHPEERYAFLDLSSSGTSQHALQNTVLANIYGLYFQRVCSTYSRNMGWVETFLPQMQKNMLLSRVFEFIFTTLEPSVKSVTKNGDIIFQEESRTGEDIQESALARDCVKSYFLEFLKLGDLEQRISCTIGQQVLDLYRQPSFQNGIEIFLQHDIFDDVSGEQVSCLMPDEGKIVEHPYDTTQRNK